jgi:hypothetical protein
MRRWVGGDTSEVDSSGVQLDEEQDIEPLQEHGVHGEEVAGHDAGCLPAQERPPRGGGRSRRRLETVGAQDPGDGASGNPAAKAQQLPTDALVAPSAGSRWPAAQSRSAPAGEPMADPALRWIGPAPAHHAPVPSKQRLERDHEDRPSGPGKETAERRQQRTVLGLEPGAWVLAAQDGQLVAEDQDLDLFGARRPPAEHQQLEQAAQPGRRTTRPSPPPRGRQHATAHHSPADHTPADLRD